MSPSPENSDPGLHGKDPDTLVFLSTAPLQDPTLRTPGSEIPEGVYAAGDAEPFDLPAAPQRVLGALPRDNRLLALLLALVLLAVILFTAIRLYRDTRKNVEPVPVMPSNSSLSHPRNHTQLAVNRPAPTIPRSRASKEKADRDELPSGKNGN